MLLLLAVKHEIEIRKHFHVFASHDKFWQNCAMYKNNFYESILFRVCQIALLHDALQ